MRRLIQKTFNFEKQRYMFTVDTDGLELKLNCYLGSSEKNEQVVIQKFSPIWKRINQLLRDEYGYNIAQDVMYETNSISEYVRKFYDIRFPQDKKLEQAGALLEYQEYIVLGKEEAQILSYLTWKYAESIKIETNDKIYLFLDEEITEDYMRNLWDSIQKKEIELKKMKEIAMEIDYQTNVRKKVSR